MASFGEQWSSLGSAMKSFVCQGAIFTSGIEPAGLRSWVGVEVRNIGLDVEQWGAVENVDVGHVQLPALPSHKPDHGHSDGVGATRGAGREEPVFLGVAVGDDVVLETRDPIQPVNRPYALEALDVVQRGSKAFVDDNRAFSALRIAGLNGSARRLDEGAMDDPHYP